MSTVEPPTKKRRYENNTGPTELRMVKMSMKDEDMKIVNHLCTLSTFATWPRVLFELVSEYCHTIQTCYIIGGVGGIGSVAHRLNLTENKRSNFGRLVDGVWSDLPPLPRPRTSHSSACLNDYVYVTGGSTRITSGTSTSVDRFHIPSSTWSVGTSLPEVRKNHGCIAIDNSLYCLGGWHEQNICNSMFKYDLKSENWTIAPSMKHARRVSSYVVAKNHIFAFSGTETKTCEMYNVSTSRWHDISPMSNIRFLCVAVAVEDKILLMGGICKPLEVGSDPHEVDFVDEYSITSNSWRRLSWTLPIQLNGSNNTNYVSWYDSVSKLLYFAIGHADKITGCIYARRMTDELNKLSKSNEWMIVDVPHHKVDFGYEFSSTVVTS